MISYEISIKEWRTLLKKIPNNLFVLIISLVISHYSSVVYANASLGWSSDVHKSFNIKGWGDTWADGWFGWYPVRELASGVSSSIYQNHEGWHEVVVQLPKFYFQGDDGNRTKVYMRQQNHQAPLILCGPGVFQK